MDEAHTYTGAKSIDISMLLRRFRSLFPKNKLQFVLTSATISKDRSAVSRFATDLCGVPFTESDIIFGEEDRLSTSVNNRQLDLSCFNRVAFTDDDLEKWCDALHDEDRLFDLITSSILFKNKISKAAPKVMLFNALKSSPFLDGIHKLDEVCREGPVTIDDLAHKIFKSQSDEMKRIVTWLLLLGSHARADNSVPPLLPIKLHYFLRGLSGVHVCINSKCRGEGSGAPQLKWKAVFLEERETCKYCNSKVLSLSACMHCGLPVFKIYEKAEKWQTIKPGDNNPKTHLLTFKFSAEDSEDAEVLPDENESRLIRQLCLNCGSFQEGAGLFNCCDAPQIEELTVIPNEEG
ncbi:MAG: hypothetical protein L7F78_26430, partial [Syntrophales bacterium LBB04]|nr:hypothetical protein [Syntrophales bacterium LBB04]